MKLLIASDHAGFELKQAIQRLRPDLAWEDLGPQTADRVDYPDFGHKLAEKLTSEPLGTLGVLICGSGIGISIAANRHTGIRAALVENPVSARLSREHNDANVVCMGARFVAPEYAAEILDAFLAGKFEGGRHADRVAKIDLK